MVTIDMIIGAIVMVTLATAAGLVIFLAVEICSWLLRALYKIIKLV
jgi:hypothetical protein